jgi:hypothetical protein
MKSVRDTLAQEAAEAEAHQEEAPIGMQRASAPGRTVSHVYTVRMPLDRLAELRALAEKAGEQPSALMRRWVLERLDTERAHQPELADVQRNLSEAMHALDQISRRRPA